VVWAATASAAARWRAEFSTAVLPQRPALRLRLLALPQEAAARRRLRVCSQAERSGCRDLLLRHCGRFRRRRRIGGIGGIVDVIISIAPAA
jgi:hypothetical protein